MKIATRIAVTVTFLLGASSAGAQTIIDAIERYYVGVSLNVADADDSSSQFFIPAQEGAVEDQPKRVVQFATSIDRSIGAGIRGGFVAGNWRWELEYQRHDHDTDEFVVEGEHRASGGIEAELLIFSGFYDFKFLEFAGLVPYFGLGFGGGEFTVDSVDDSTTMGKVSIGVIWPWSDNLMVDAGFHMIDNFHEPTFEFESGDLEVEYSTRGLSVALNYLF